MKKWKLVFSRIKKKQGPGSPWQDALGIRDNPARITHAIYLDEATTVCRASYDHEEFPDESAGFFPNCGNCYNSLKRQARRENKNE
jgi:hypothetical protein